MKLVRYGAVGQEQPGILDAAGAVRSLRGIVEDITGEVLSAESLTRLREVDVTGLPLVESGVRLGPCIGKSSKFVAIGLNYADHAAETGGQVPDEPVVFMKATSALSGPFDPIEIPRGSQCTDWEVELGVIIGQRAKYVTEERALEHVAGYCTANDVSERDFQTKRCGTWDKGKGCDTFAPLGPWLVTRDEVPDPQNLSLWLEVDGQRRQQSSTKNMVFTVAKLVSYVSHFMSLLPGDVIFTGTPPGVGMGMKPKVFLQPGQTVRLCVEGLGEQCHTTVAAE